MPKALPPNPDLDEWARRHGLDPSRVVAPLDVRSAPTREHPSQVRVDYVALLLDDEGRAVGRDARSFLTCDPPPSPGQTDTARDRAIADRLRALVARGRVFGVVAYTWETLAEILADPGDTYAVPTGYVVGETPWQRLHRLVEARRRELGLTQEGLQAAGGPSPKWVQDLRRGEGMPTDRRRRPMRLLDEALGWDADTSWRIASGDPS